MILNIEIYYFSKKNNETLRQELLEVILLTR